MPRDASEKNEDTEIEIDLKEVLRELWRKCPAILAVCVAGGLLAGMITEFFIPQTYTSTTSILVLTKETTLTSLADLQLGSQLANDYEVLITARSVLNEVIENLGLDMEYEELKNKITVENPTDTRILEISVKDQSPTRARNIVNELASIASVYIGDMMEVVPPKIVEEGVVPQKRTSPSLPRNIVIGVLLGFLVSGGLVVGMTITDDTIKGEEDVEKYLGLSTLASVPDRRDFISGKKKKRRRGKKKGSKK
ncbi:MAG: Wzz/FepE/Etk N-terminal domain-containing protein [Clostridiales bacterium]|nr:Wzz/FepE/Etk N-terminal domain-containing protein [Clostridiales bacterium]